MSNPNTPNEERIGEWAILEIMGHAIFAGYMTDAVVAGAGFIRIDVPEVVSSYGDETVTIPGFTKVFSPSAVFGFTPCSEAVARDAAKSFRAKPYNIFESPMRALPRGVDDPPDPDDYDHY